MQRDESDANGIKCDETKELMKNETERRKNLRDTYTQQEMMKFTDEKLVSDNIHTHTQSKKSLIWSCVVVGAARVGVHTKTNR